MKRHAEALLPPAGGDALANRRLALCLGLAIAAHAAVIFGVRFTVSPAPQREPVLSLNVSLVEHPGGAPAAAAATPGPPTESVEPEAPAAPEPVAEPRPPAPEAVAAATPQPEPPPPTRRPAPAPAQTPPPRPRPEPSPPRPRAEPDSRPARRPQPSGAPSAIDLMSSGLQLARRTTVPETGSAREKHLDPQSMTTLERFYMETWVRKVQQVGTLNFPEEARRRDLTGSLVMEVAVRSDGTVRSIRLLRSSGHEVLDQGARHIVELAAPFAPFPDALRERYDVLHIKRKWVFEHGSRLSGG